MDKLLDATMDFLYSNEENMDDEQAEIVRYGLELFFLKVFFFAATIIIGILMGSFGRALFLLLYYQVSELWRAVFMPIQECNAL